MIRASLISIEMSCNIENLMLRKVKTNSIVNNQFNIVNYKLKLLILLNIQHNE